MMIILRRLALGITLCSLTASRALAGGILPSPSPVVSTTPDPCASSQAEFRDDVPTAFAYDLTDHALLRFLLTLANVPERQQRAVFTAVAGAASTPAQQQVTNALSGYCATLDEEYATTRALSLVANLWTPGEIHDQKKFGAFASVVANEIAAIAMSDKLDVNIVQSASAPFAEPADVVHPSPEPSASSSGCNNENAHTLHLIQPKYPVAAGANGSGGIVRIKVTLNDRGEVRSARPYTDTIQGEIGREDLVNQAMFAAAATTYAPEISDCRAIAGAYMFTADFRVRLR